MFSEDYQKKLESSVNFYKKAQLLFFMMFFLSVGLGIFLYIIIQVGKIPITIGMMVVAAISLYAFIECKKNREAMEDFMLLYTMKRQNASVVNK